MEKTFFLKISIIGAGRLGLTLAYSIIKKDNPAVSVVSVSSRSDKSLDTAKEILFKQDSNILFTKNNLLAASVSNCIFICTPDDEIENACRSIFEEGKNADTENYECLSRGSFRKNHAKTYAFNPEDMTVIHFSGSKKTDILISAEEKGASVACMHPLKSFASVLESAKTLDNTLYGVTYDPADKRIQKTIDILADFLKGRTIFVDNDKKTLYHACACIASNYLVSLMDFAVGVGKEIGLNPEAFLSGILNLSEGTMANIKKFGTKKALTGPIARGDLSTIQEHVKSLKNLKTRQFMEIYGIMGKKTAEIAFENKWIDDKTYKKLLYVLKD
ncbi:DUF2520 domain-containing protein [bacterium]|nr:DUF2520 domain-containing protein [bacterium]